MARDDVQRTSDGADPVIDRAVAELRRMPDEPPGAVEWIMRRVRLERPAWLEGRRGPAVASRRMWQWLRRPRTLRLSPLSGLAAAAVVAGLLVGSWELGRQRAPASEGPAGSAEAVEFVLVAPGAQSVSLVGDFNDWNPVATPLSRSGSHGIWSVELPLERGRHLYAFIVDEVWTPDAFAPRAPDSEFGAPNSVIVVSGGT